MYAAQHLISNEVQQQTLVSKELHPLLHPALHQGAPPFATQGYGKLHCCEAVLENDFGLSVSGLQRDVCL